jgi:hypothetical protein
MKKQFANVIKMIPSYDVASIDGTSVIPKVDKSFDLLPTDNDIELTDDAKEGDAGEHFEQETNAVVEKLTANQRTRYEHGTPIILIVFENSMDNPVVVGALDEPAYIRVNPAADYDELQITRNSKNAVL